MTDQNPTPDSIQASSKSSVFKRLFYVVIGVLLAAFLAIQFVPVDRSNPPVEGDVPASSEVKAVLKRACYDCHSNETVWPLYSYIAPASWMVAKDVREGRDHLNFSTWPQIDTQEQIEKMHEVWEEVADGEMPPWFYTPVHRDAQLTSEDKTLLRNWAIGSGGSPATEEEND